MFNPQWLKTFIALEEEGSFTRTAERLDLTQAAVSQHIRHLEDELGVLFIRRPRQLELTPAGAAFLDYCNEIERADKNLQQRLSAACEDCGDISLITPGSIGLVLYPILLDLQSANRGLIMRHRFAPDSEVLEAILQNRYELGLITFRPEDPRIAASLFAEEPLELVIPAEETVEGWQDLERIGFIDHPDGQAMAGRLLSRLFPGNPGIRSLPCSGFSNQVGLLLHPVARGLGFTILPRYARQAFALPEAIRVVKCETSVIDKLWLIHRAEWALSNRATRVATYLRERLANMAGTSSTPAASGQPGDGLR